MKRFLLLVLTLGVWCAFCGPVGAVSVIRDTEAETTLRGYVRDIFQAAGLEPENATVVILNDPSVNAFVAGGQTIFIHSGLIMKAQTVDELVFVLSHETGHIVGGHIVRGYQTLQNAQTTALISTVLGGALAVVGGAPGAAIAVMMGVQASGMGVFTKYRQTEESAADRTAVDIMDKMGYSMHGFEGIMKTLTTYERLNSRDDGTYLRTHPMTQTRVHDLQRFLQHPRPLTRDEKFDLLRAKMVGFLEKPETVLRTYTGKTSADLYAQSIALYRLHRFDEAFDKLDTLIKRDSDNSYFHELKGQFLFEAGRLDAAAESYQQAYRLKSDSALTNLSYAQVLLERAHTADLPLSEKLLQAVVAKEPDTPIAWQLLAKVYDRQKRPDMVAYAMAEFSRATGDKVMAKKRAEKAITAFPDESGIRQKLQDIIDIGG